MLSELARECKKQYFPLEEDVPFGEHTLQYHECSQAILPQIFSFRRGEQRKKGLADKDYLLLRRISLLF